MLTPWRSAPSRSSACSAAKAGRSPASSPANAATDAPRGEVGDGGALVDGDRRPQLDRHPPPQRCLQPQARRGLVGPRQRLGPAVGLGAPVDGDGHTPLALHQQPGQRLVGLVGGTRDRAHPWPDAVVDHHLAVDDPFEAVGADVAQPVDVERVPQERGRSAAHHGHRPQHRHEPGQRGAGRGEHRGRAGVADDRRERTVEVGEERARGGIVDERSQRGREGHDASPSGGYAVPMITRQSASDAPAGGLEGYGCTCAPFGDAVEREQGALTVEPLDALDHGAVAFAAQVRRRLHVVAGALELVGQDLGPALHPRRVVDLDPHLRGRAQGARRRRGPGPSGGWGRAGDGGDAGAGAAVVEDLQADDAEDHGQADDDRPAAPGDAPGAREEPPPRGAVTATPDPPDGLRGAHACVGRVHGGPASR